MPFTLPPPMPTRISRSSSSPAQFGHQVLASRTAALPEPPAAGAAGITITSLAALGPILLSPQQRAAIFGDSVGTLAREPYRMLELVFAFEGEARWC
jgi:hypothetical protein